jgi:hypothetical protein
MKYQFSPTKLPLNAAGEPVLACDMDDLCVEVDCEDMMDEIQSTLSDNLEAPDYVAHYCGLGYLARLQALRDGEEME